jgi:hypothetical protein
MATSDKKTRTLVVLLIAFAGFATDFWFEYRSSFSIRHGLLGVVGAAFGLAAWGCLSVASELLPHWLPDLIKEEIKPRKGEGSGGLL